MFFVPTSVALHEIAKVCSAKLQLNGVPENSTIDGAAAIENAVSGNITFVDNAKYVKHLETTSATAVFCSDKHSELVPQGVAILCHDQPYKAYAQALSVIYPTAAKPQPVTGEIGISEKAVLSENVALEEEVVVEAGAVIGKDVSIGKGSMILAGAVVGAGVQIGRGSVVGCNATVLNAFIGDEVVIHNGVQIGQDGFGFAMGPGGHRKIPQVGRVIIQDRVEIGANSTVDRGANRDTVVGEGTKIDNLVQIGHNAIIGSHCVIVGLAGISGSATLGDYVVVAGQVGVVGHTKVGDGAQIGGGSGVHGDVAPGEKVMGYPAIKASTWMRDAAKIMLADKRARRKKRD